MSLLNKNPDVAAIFSSTQIDEIKKAASDVSDGETSKVSKDAIRSLFGTLIALDTTKAKALILTTTEKLDKEGAAAVFGDDKSSTALAKVWKQNLKTYGEGDVGILVTAFLMNLMQLPPGEGCWILADDIHAYVEGMSSSCIVAAGGRKK